MDTTKPVKTFRDGPVGASVWLRQTKAGVFYDLTVSRSWKDQDSGESGYSRNFSDRHLESLVWVTEQAKDWIAEKKQDAQTVTLPGSCVEQ